MADSVKAKERMGGFLKPSTAHTETPPETAAAPAARPKARGRDPVKSIGVGLRTSEAAELDSIAWACPVAASWPGSCGVSWPTTARGGRLYLTWRP
jgi:hypothetical protein